MVDTFKELESAGNKHKNYIVLLFYKEKRFIGSEIKETNLMEMSWN